MGPEATRHEVGPKDADSCVVIYPKEMMEDRKNRKPSIVFECEDIQRKYEEMSSRGVEFHQKLNATSWGGAFAIFRNQVGN